MILASSIYQDAVDLINVETNGQYSYAMHNRISRLAELDLIDWLSGDIYNRQPPEPYINQKTKDWLAPFIKTFTAHAANGSITRPDDYYLLDNLYLIGDFNNATEPTECENEDDNETVVASECNTVVETMDGDQYYVRCNTYIEGLKPSFAKPIAKEVGKKFEFLPKDIGSVGLDYIRYPVFANIVTSIDPTFNDEVVNEAATTNYEWDEKARSVLLFFIVDRFSNRTSNKSMKESNLVTGRTPKG